MTELELMLRTAGAELDWPPTPDLAALVVPQIEGVAPLQPGNKPAPAARRRPRIGIRRPLAVALAVLLIAAATAAAVPGIRDPVLDWLGLGSVRIERVPKPLPEAPGRSLGLGEHTTIADARARLGFAPLMPSGIGRPAVYYDGFVPGGQLGLVYRGGRVLVTEVIGDISTPYVEKFVGAATKIERLRVAGDRALWIRGLHQYAYLDRAGAIRPDTVRTTGSVLLWRRGKLLLRLEGARSKAEALRIARAVRAVP
jgi:hypothetical protein